MTYNSPFTFIVLGILIIGILMGYYFFLQKKHGRENPLSTQQSALVRPGTLHVNKSVKSSNRVVKKIIAGNKGKSIRIEVSAELPEGVSIDFTLKLEDEHGKSTSKKYILAHKALPKSSTDAQETPAILNIENDSAGQAQPKNNSIRQFMINTRQMGLAQTIRRNFPLKNAGAIWLAAAIAVYALMISIGIDRFPIYFFTDEAIHMNLASDFIRDHFQNYDHEFMPTFFIAEGWVNGTSVYVQVLPYLLFGKSITITRLVSASITLLAALTLGLLLKQVFRVKYHWAGVFLLLTTPAWFFHARTAFEYAEVASFYMMFLYFYSLYRAGHLSSLYAAIFSGALAFYTHGLGQMLMTVTGLALFIVDFRYHTHPDRRKTVLFGLGLGLILLMPFVRYYLAHSGESAAQIKRRGSYWFNDEMTTLQKIWEFIRQYTYGLNPQYWYLHNPIDIARHVMKDYGNGLLITFPFVLIGFIYVLKNLRRPPYHVIFIAFLAAPFPASIVAVGMPRMLWMAIPIAIITALGLSLCLEQLELLWVKISKPLPWIVFALLTSLSLFMLRDALLNGPTWFDDYGLYGMQYGAKQVFEETVVPELKKNPDLMFVISPTWANGTDKFADFFIPKNLLSRVVFGRPENRVADPSGITTNTRFILPYNEYDDLLKNPKFKDIVIYKIIPYPNGKPGFYVVNLKLADNINELLEAEKIKNRTPVEETMNLDGQEVRVLHSPFDSGGLIHVFDNDPDTLAKVLEANPFVFDLYPTTPINTQSVVIQTGSLTDFTITISLYAPGSTAPEVYTKTFKGLPPDPVVTMDFDRGPSRSARIYIEIKDNTSGETSQIHVRQIAFK